MTETFLPKGLPLPAPSPDGLDKAFWDGCNNHELVIQRCADCGAYRHPPEVICNKCLSFNSRWERVSGKGVIFTCINVVYPPHPALKERVPFNVVIVELPDAPGVRMVGNVVDCTYEDIEIGMPVQVHFEDHPEEGVILPLWKRAD